MTKHPSETELALLAGEDAPLLSRFRLRRHVRDCAPCQDTVSGFVMLRSALAADRLVTDHIPEIDWERLSAEMTANIHLGLEAGDCVRTSRSERFWNPRLAVAFGSLAILLGAGIALRAPAPAPRAPQVARASILESTGAGLALRSGESSLTLLNHHGSVADQTVSTQGEIRASYVEGGAVTFNAVYLE
jgi:hypothetical protein